MHVELVSCVNMLVVSGVYECESSSTIQPCSLGHWCIVQYGWYPACLSVVLYVSLTRLSPPTLSIASTSYSFLF